MTKFISAFNLFAQAIVSYRNENSKVYSANSVDPDEVAEPPHMDLRSLQIQQFSFSVLNY